MAAVNSGAALKSRIALAAKSKPMARLQTRRGDFRCNYYLHKGVMNGWAVRRLRLVEERAAIRERNLSLTW
jgi:hypothetical protein